MKKHLSLSLIILLGLSVWAQKNQILIEKSELKPIKYNKSQQRINNSTNDSIFWQEDFTNIANGGDADDGWIYVDSSGLGGFKYIDADTIFSCYSLAGGENEPGINMIPGSSPNGYLHLPLQFYNCVPGVFPREVVDNPQNINAYIESPWIDFSNAPERVVLEYRTRFILCCSSAHSSVDVNIGIDIDGDNIVDSWTTFNGRDFDGEVWGEWSPDIWEADISDATIGAMQIKIQIHVHHAAHYMFSIDDIKILYQQNDIEVLNYYACSHGIHTSHENNFDDFNYKYSEVPHHIKTQLQFGAHIHQYGSLAENVKATFSIDSLGTNIWSDTSTTTIPILTYQNDSVLYSDTSNQYTNTHLFYAPNLISDDFYNQGTMDDGIPYTFSYHVYSDDSATEENLNNNVAHYEFAQTQGRYSYHWQSTDSVAGIEHEMGPFSYSYNSPENGDILANRFSFYQDEGEEFKIYGMRLYIPESENVTFDTSGHGVHFKPIMFYYDVTAHAGDGGWVEIEDIETYSYILNECNEGHYLRCGFNESDVEDYTFASGEYLVGIRIEDYNNQKIAIGVDQKYTQGNAHFLMKRSPWQDTWYYWAPNGSVMIDAYTSWEQLMNDSGPCQVCTGVAEIKNQNVKLYPNPTTGILKIENIESARIKVYNLTGQMLLSTQVNTKYAQIDLSHLSKGSYLIQISEPDKITTKKIHLVK